MLATSSARCLTNAAGEHLADSEAESMDDLDWDMSKLVKISAIKQKEFQEDQAKMAAMRK